MLDPLFVALIGALTGQAIRIAETRGIVERWLGLAGPTLRDIEVAWGAFAGALDEDGLRGRRRAASAVEPTRMACESLRGGIAGARAYGADARSAQLRRPHRPFRRTPGRRLLRAHVRGRGRRERRSGPCDGAVWSARRHAPHPRDGRQTDEDDTDVYRFLHPTLRDALAARYIRALPAHARARFAQRASSDETLDRRQSAASVSSRSSSDSTARSRPPNVVCQNSPRLPSPASPATVSTVHRGDRRYSTRASFSLASGGASW